MNTLSMLLYLADLAGNLTGLAIAALVILGLSLTFSWMPFMFADKSPSDWTGWLANTLRRLVLPLGICAVIIALMPSRNTIMLIAASEVGEAVLASEQAQELGGEAGQLATDSLRVLRKFINDQLEEPAE